MCVIQNHFYFLDFPETKELFKFFDEYKIEARFVGGCVRDALLGIISSDFDIAVNIPIINLTKLLDLKSVKYIKSGIKYGSIIAILGSVKFDITSLRCDSRCFGRDCEIDIVDSFKEDSNRRDFSINALYVSQNGEIFDYVNGIEDLYNRRIIFIGDPEKKITEDYLRILRYYRFCAKMGDESGRYSDILSKNASLLTKLPIERIQKELFIIINSKVILNMMYANNILQQISENINIEAYNKLDDLNVSILVKMIVLFGVDELLNVFRLKREEKRLILDYRGFMRETLDYCYYKRGADFTHEIMILKHSLFKGFSRFPLTYQDVPVCIKNISKILKECERWWVNNNFPSREKTLLFMTKNIL